MPHARHLPDPTLPAPRTVTPALGDTPGAEVLHELQAILELLDSTTRLDRFRGESRLTRLGLESGPLVIPVLLDVLSTSPWSPRHIGILEAFKQIRPVEAAPIVAEFLKDDRAEVRLAAVRSLRWLNVDIEPFTRLLGDEDWRIRRECVFCISSRGGRHTLLPLARALRDEHFEVRAVTANALGRLGLVEAAPLLRKALRDESQRVRAMAAWSLEKWQDPATLRALLESLPDATGEAKRRILHAMRRDSTPRVTAAMIEACNDPDPQVRAQAALDLAHGGIHALKARLAGLFKSAGRAVQHKAAWIVACLALLSRDDLHELLCDSDENMRYFAVCALGYDNLNTAHSQLLDSTANEARTVRKAAAHGLKQITEKGSRRGKSASR